MSRIMCAALVILLAGCARSTERSAGASPTPTPPDRAAAAGDAMPNAVIVTPSTADGHPYLEYQVTRQVEPVGVRIAPLYPPDLRAAGLSGEVLVMFVVDTTGHAEMNSLKVLRSTHDLFTLAVRASLPRLRFSPAEIEGRKVRQWVQQPYTFSLPTR